MSTEVSPARADIEGRRSLGKAASFLASDRWNRATTTTTTTTMRVCIKRDASCNNRARTYRTCPLRSFRVLACARRMSRYTYLGARTVDQDSEKQLARKVPRAGQFSGRIARVNGLNELKSHYAVKRSEVFGARARIEPSALSAIPFLRLMNSNPFDIPPRLNAAPPSALPSLPVPARRLIFFTRPSNSPPLQPPPSPLARYLSRRPRLSRPRARASVPASYRSCPLRFLISFLSPLVYPPFPASLSSGASGLERHRS